MKTLVMIVATAGVLASSMIKLRHEPVVPAAGALAIRSLHAPRQSLYGRRMPSTVPKRLAHSLSDPRAAASRWGVFGLALMGTVMLADLAAAQSVQCRQIDSRKERNACYEQQRQAAKKKTPDGPPNDNMLDQMKLENDLLSKKLQGICRGC